MKANVLLVRVLIVPVAALLAMTTLPLMAPPQDARALATGGLPTTTEVQGLFSRTEILRADPDIQKAYIAGVLDALMAVFAEGEAYAEAGLDPRNAYGIVYETVAGIPNEISLETLRQAIVDNVRTSPTDHAALAIWRILALHHCCWNP